MKVLLPLVVLPVNSCPDDVSMFDVRSEVLVKNRVTDWLRLRRSKDTMYELLSISQVYRAITSITSGRF